MQLIRHHGNLVPLGRLTALKLLLEKARFENGEVKIVARGDTIWFRAFQIS